MITSFAQMQYKKELMNQEIIYFFFIYALNQYYGDSYKAEKKNKEYLSEKGERFELSL